MTDPPRKENPSPSGLPPKTSAFRPMSKERLVRAEHDALVASPAETRREGRNREGRMKLQLAQKLPTLACNAVLVGHAKKADLIWSREDFFGICEHTRNGNEPNFFMMAYRDKTGAPRFVKAKTARADRRAAWAWDTITGQAKSPASIGFYPRNEKGETQWGCMDVDAHDGDTERARRLALSAFDLFYQHPQLFVALGTSGGGGWHLFVFSRDYHPCSEWIRLFRQAADLIGSPIEKGKLEIFPSETRGTVGYGVRAPGSWNPKNGDFGLILFENVSAPLRLLSGTVERRESISLSISVNSTYDGGPKLTDRKKLTDRQKRLLDAFQGFEISKESTRHDQLLGLVSKLYRFYSRAVLEELARHQFQTKSVKTNADLATHLKEFDEIWTYWLTRYRAELTESEKSKEALLATDNEREAFRIAWGFANIDKEKDFAYSSEFIAWNLQMSLEGVCKQRRKLCSLGVIKQSAHFIANVAAARFRWIANDETPSRLIRVTRTE
jgi:hypothetical protein